MRETQSGTGGWATGGRPRVGRRRRAVAMGVAAAAPGVAFAVAMRARAAVGQTGASTSTGGGSMDVDAVAFDWHRVLVFDDDDDDDDDDARRDGGDGDDGDDDAVGIRAATIRAVACAKTGRYREAREIAFGDAFERRAARDALSFAAMALRAEIPYHLNDPVGSLDALCALHARCASRARDATTSEEARATWRRRRNASARAVARRYLMGNRPRAALVWLDALARDEPDEAEHVSAAGRAHLMMGDLEGARLCFEAAETLARASGGEKCKETLARVMCDKGDLLLTSGKFPEAKATFAEALSTNDADATVKINAAVAAVYAGDLDASRALLENGLVGAARANRTSTEFDIVSPSAVRNLNSIYELTARTPAESKHSMNVFVKSIAPEDFDVSCMAT